MSGITSLRRWLDEWMNEWTNEWMNGWMDGWMDEWTSACLRLWLDESEDTNLQVDKWPGPDDTNVAQVVWKQKRKTIEAKEKYMVYVEAKKRAGAFLWADLQFDASTWRK